MARKTIHQADKSGKPIVGTQELMHEGNEAWENFEKLAKKIFATKNTKNE